MRSSLVKPPDAIAIACVREASKTDTNTGEGLLRDTEILERLQRNIGHDDQSTILAVESMAHLLKTFNVLYDALSDMLAPHDLTVPKYNLLVILYNTPDHHLCMSEIGERMSFTRTNITKLVDSLEQQGLVRRANRPGDRRVVLAELTEGGLCLMRRVMPLHYANIRALWTGMTADECLLLTHLLLKLRRNLLSPANEVVTLHEP